MSSNCTRKNNSVLSKSLGLVSEDVTAVLPTFFRKLLSLLKQLVVLKPFFAKHNNKSEAAPNFGFVRRTVETGLRRRTGAQEFLLVQQLEQTLFRLVVVCAHSLDFADADSFSDLEEGFVKTVQFSRRPTGSAQTVVRKASAWLTVRLRTLQQSFLQKQFPLHAILYSADGQNRGWHPAFAEVLSDAARPVELFLSLLQSPSKTGLLCADCKLFRKKESSDKVPVQKVPEVTVNTTVYKKIAVAMGSEFAATIARRETQIRTKNKLVIANRVSRLETAKRTLLKKCVGLFVSSKKRALERNKLHKDLFAQCRALFSPAEFERTFASVLQDEKFALVEHADTAVVVIK